MTEQMKQAMYREECRIDIPIPDGLDKRSFMTGRYLGFCRGVNWYSDNAWHDSSEEPKDNSKVILCQVDDKTQSVLKMKYNSSDKNFHLTSPLGNDYSIPLNYPKLRWAYPEDILP